MSGEAKDNRRVRLETNAPSVDAHGSGLHDAQPHMPHFSTREMPGYAAPTRSSSSKTRSTTDAAYEREHRSREREHRSKERDHWSKEREHRSKERDHRSKSREKSRSREKKSVDSRTVAFQAHTLPARLPTTKAFYQVQDAKPSKRRPRQSKSADGRTRVIPPWATSEIPLGLNEGCFFSNIRSPRPSFFIIHPEWTSESVTRKRLNIVEKPQVIMPGRRCFSAPPPRSRNPITWEYS